MYTYQMNCVGGAYKNITLGMAKEDEIFQLKTLAEETESTIFMYAFTREEQNDWRFCESLAMW